MDVIANAMTNAIDAINTVVWGYILIYGLLAVGIYFSIRLRFLQIFRFREFIRAVTRTPEKDSQGITPIQALTTSLASRVGTGNIAGVAVAVYTGGPGALFWMWIVALLGMATAYAESALAQLYKVNDHHGLYRGGPAFYISRGLKSPWAGAVFSVAVPFMAVAYLGVALWVLVANIDKIPEVISLIVRSAFGLDQAAGGLVGGMTAAMLNGVKRGLYSNEAGMGSAPNIAAVAIPSPHHPSSQGFVQALGVFIDTILICTATGVMILMSDALQPGSGVTGTVLTQHALAYHIGEHGKDFVALAVFFFAFTSIIGNYSYAEGALTYLNINNKPCLFILRTLVLVFIVWGAREAITTVFDAADAVMGIMAIINLVGISLLSGLVVKLTRDYFEQAKHGDPRFRLSDYPELKGQIEEEIWK